MADQPSPEFAALQLATARARLLGRLAGTLAHDLANVLAAATGLAGELQPRHAEDAALLAQLDQGARRGAAQSRLLAKLLGQDEAGYEVMALEELLEGVRSLVERHCVRRGVPFAAVSGPAGPTRVRVVTAEATQALLGLALAALEPGVAGIELAAAVGERALAGGRVRPVGSLVLRVQAPGPTLAAAAVGVARMQSGAPSGLVLDPVGDAVAQAALVMAVGGGELVVTAATPALQIELHWPIARS
jgi:signal transduction histidine kinase